ncbi:hypothetical protein BG011_001898 [Mortierella polycephala]|uniref:Uncharacterized protein n=1 Tax=Mortierella polycephala TaxID=41804 RepID=A0A9P6Q4H3_9FUNG|nr:hypothetical protein BG011_001898 [Mortierella polycephala]
MKNINATLNYYEKSILTRTTGRSFCVNSTTGRTSAKLVAGSEPYAGQSLERNGARIKNSPLDCAVSAVEAEIQAGVVEPGEDDAEDGDEDGVEDEAEVEDEDGDEAEAEDGGSADEAEEDIVDDEEVSGLLANITKAQHPTCTWKSGDTCIACLFQQYQRECVQDLQENGLRKADIADVIMRRTFEPRILGQLVKSPDLPDPGIDDAAIVKAVRLRMNNKHKEASEAIGKVERTIRLLFDNLFESLPDEVDRSVSEVTFTVNYVAPVLNSILRIIGRTDVQYPNTESSVQKLQGLKPDRPDILVKAYGYEVMYGEITGPCRATCKAKTNWDLFRLARFGKTYLDKGNDSVPLLQVVHDRGLAMKLTFQVRGVYLLERVGWFTIPCTIAAVPALLATLPVLLNTKMAVETISGSNFDKNRKRSWRFDDIVDAKKRIK